MRDTFISLVNDHTVNSGDMAAGGLTLASLFQWLPEASAFLSIIWIGLRIYVMVRDELFKKPTKEDDGDK